jgi:hypothetical protein
MQSAVTTEQHRMLRQFRLARRKEDGYITPEGIPVSS